MSWITAINENHERDWDYFEALSRGKSWASLLYELRIRHWDNIVTWYRRDWKTPRDIAAILNGN